MSIVVTNGSEYIWYTQTGAVKKTSDINLAQQFPNSKKAIKIFRRAPQKTKGFYVFDTNMQQVLWNPEQQAPQEQKSEMQEQTSEIPKKKQKRKHFSVDTKRLIYLQAGCKCELCGRKLLFEEATLDHIIPLSRGGLDEVENLACVCYEDNQFKKNILPEDFLDRIVKIFMYQMEKKNGNSVRWKIMYRMLKRMV